MPLPKLYNLFDGKTCLRFCAIDLQTSFLAFAIASKKSNIVSETCSIWSQFGIVSETWGLAVTLVIEGIILDLHLVFYNDFI